MKVESGKIIELHIVNKFADGVVWGTFEQVGMYPDDFPYKPLREALLGMELHIDGNEAEVYVGGIERTPQLVFKIPPQNLKHDKELNLGMVFKTQFQEKTFTGIITNIEDDYVTLDCNHPYAGICSVGTKFIVRDIREPTPEELKGGFKPSIICC